MEIQMNVKAMVLAAALVIPAAAHAEEIDLSKYRPMELRGYHLNNFEHKYDGSKYLIVAPLGIVPSAPKYSYTLDAPGGETEFPSGVIGGNPMTEYHIPTFFPSGMWVELNH